MTRRKTGNRKMFGSQLEEVGEDNRRYEELIDDKY